MITLKYEFWEYQPAANGARTREDSGTDLKSDCPFGDWLRLLRAPPFLESYINQC